MTRADLGFIKSINNVLTESLTSHNSKLFWQYIKATKQDNIGVAPIKGAERKAKAELINKQFQSVFSKKVVCTGKTSVVVTLVLYYHGYS